MQKNSQQLDKYLLLERIGEGGMGVVYKAMDTRVERVVALKVLAKEMAKNTRYVQRFLREAQSAASLDHPNIVKALDVGQANGLYYFVMEYVEGSDLRDWLRERKQFSEDNVASLALHICNALQHAATRNIIHRDIKPENIMLTPTGEVKLTDLGLAKVANESGATVTQAGIMVGSPHYASPEQIRGETTIDGRSDIYSLGITLYHLIVGKPPFDGSTAPEVASKHLYDPIPNPKQFRPDISDAFCFVLMKMTQKDPENRYQNPDELIIDLAAVRNRTFQIPQTEPDAIPTADPLQQATPAAAIQPPPKRSSPLGALAAMVLLAAVGGASYFFFIKEKPAREQPQGTIARQPATISPAEKFDKKLKDAYLYSRKNPHEYKQIVEMFEEIAQQGQQVTAASTARQHLSSWVARWEAAGKDEYSKRQAAADPLLKLKDFDSAKRIWDQFPESLQTQTIAYWISQQKEKIAELRETVPAVEVKPVSEENESTVNEPEVPVGLKQINAQLAAYTEIAKALRPGFHTRDLSAISDTLDELSVNLAFEFFAPFYAQLKKDLPVLQKFLDRAREELKEKVGSEISISGIPVKLLELNGDELMLDFAGNNKAKEFSKLKSRDFVKLLSINTGDAESEDLLALGLIALFDYRQKDADNFLSEIDKNRAETYLEFTGMDYEVRAQAEIEKCRTELDKSKIKSASEIFKTLTTKFAYSRIFNIEKELLAERLDELKTERKRLKAAFAELVKVVDRLGDESAEDIKKDYKAKKEEIQQAYDNEMISSSNYHLEETTNLVKDRRGRIKGEDRYFAVEIVNAEINKADKLKRIERWLKTSNINAEGVKRLKEDYKELKEDLATIKRKFSSLPAKLKKSYSTKRAALATRRRRLTNRVQEGTVLSEEEMRAYLKGED